VSQTLPQHGSQYYIAKQQQFESNARTYPRRLPIAIRKAKGLYVTDADGKVYMDCLCGAGTLALGHNHPTAVEAIRSHLDEGYPLHTLDLTTPVKDAFVEELFASLPAEFASRAKIQFCGPTGADGVEAALKLVKTATGRGSILAFQGGYHGQTHGTLALMGNLGPKSPVTGLMPDVHFLPYPYAYRCPPGSGAYDAQYGADHIEYLLDDPESGIPHPAAMILEVVQGEGGSIPAPDEWLREIRRITRERNIPLILDEVQTGWGRTGKLYAFEHAGIIPDVLVLSKAIGGSLPLSVVVYDKSLDLWQPGAHAGTFRGNQLAMSAGLATLRFLIENDIPAHVERMGRLLRDQLEEIQLAHPFFGDVRGRGLMVGVEVVDPERTDRWGRPPHDGARARRIQQQCFKRGLILEVGGRHGSVLRFLPPLIVTEAEVDAIADVVAEACAAAAVETREVARV
jgi:diaminobutyrate-2-oxoglutarate transaminase